MFFAKWCKYSAWRNALECVIQEEISIPKGKLNNKKARYNQRSSVFSLCLINKFSQLWCSKSPSNTGWILKDVPLSELMLFTNDLLYCLLESTLIKPTSPLSIRKVTWGRRTTKHLSLWEKVSLSISQRGRILSMELQRSLWYFLRGIRVCFHSSSRQSRTR